MTAEPTAGPTAADASVGPGDHCWVRPLQPEQDADLVHSWVTQERARFWGMLTATRDEVRDIYQFVDSLPTHHAYLVLRQDTPVALFQAYEVAHDPLAEHYDVRPGDVGLHLLLAPPAGPPEGGHTARVFAAMVRFVRASTGCTRLVAEPDAANTKAIDRLVRLGFTLGPVVQLEHKQARLTFLDLA